MDLQMQLVPHYNTDDYDAVIGTLYQGFPSQQQASIANRLEHISRCFLDKPYCVGALGEGLNGRFDQNPLYRTDAFDCVTLVNTTLALAMSQDLNEFKNNLLRLNYYGAEPTYQKRYHFTSVDWNVQNAKAGVLADITSELFSATDTAVTKIDRPNWFLHRNLSDIKLLESVPNQAADKLLTELHALASQMKSENNELTYVPLAALLEDTALFKKIPNASIVEIVRPNWDLRDKIGTCLNVSHLGFVFWLDNTLTFRHASSEEKHVLDVPLQAYLSTYLDSSTVKGINVQALRIS